MEANKVLLQKMYTKIIIEFSSQTGKSLEESMDYFYKSTTYDLVKMVYLICIVGDINI